MDQNTFSEGVAPGGLREQNQIKLLICYILKTLGKPLTRSQLNEILQEYPVANYFEANQAMSELVSSSVIVSELVDGEEELNITARAEFDVASIERSLPRSVREKAIAAALKILQRERIKRESSVEVTELEGGGFHVTFTVRDVETELLKLTVYVSDKEQTETVKRNFFNDAVSIYSGIISSLTVE